MAWSSSGPVEAATVDAGTSVARWLRHVAVVAVVALATASWGGAVPAADADTHVSWVATGTIDRVDLDLRGAGIEVGDPFTVRFTFDTSADDISADDPTRGDYEDLIASVEVEIDGGADETFTWAATPAGTFLESTSTVFDNWLGPTGDDTPRDQWWLQASEGWSGPSLNGYSIHHLQRFLNLFDADASAFDTDSLPTSPPDLAPFDTRQLFLAFTDVDDFRASITGDVETLAVDGTPDPVDVLVSESVGVSDTVTVAVQAEVGVAEGVGVTDEVRIAVGIDVPLTERVGVSDHVTVAVQAVVPVTEAVGVTDDVRIVVGRDVAVGERVGVTDRVTVAVEAAVPVAESVGVSDVVTIDVGVSTSDGRLLDEDGNLQDTFHTGGTARLTGDGFAPDTTVEIELRSDPIPLGSTTADGTGAIDVTVTLPPDAPAGEHTLVGVGVDPDGIVHEVRAELTLLDGSPSIDVGTPEPAQHSDGLAHVLLTITDPNSAPSELTVTATGLPDDVSVAPLACNETTVGTTCTTRLAGTITAPAGTYTSSLTIMDGAHEVTTGVTIVVLPEDGRVTLSPSNPVSVTIDPDTGSSGPVTLRVRIGEEEPDAGHDPGPVDLATVGVAVTLEPLDRGPTLSANCTRAVTNDVLTLTCTVDDLPTGTYAVGAALAGRLIAGADEGVLTVSDPDLGFAAGGGEFLWPGTATPDCLGDRTAVGFTMEHNRKGTNVKGSFLLVRHACDGGIFRVRSNALDGLAIGSTDDVAWASFSGRATFLAPGMDEEEGNHSFTVYVEDGDTDRFWIEVRDKDGNVIEDASLPRPGSDHAVALSGGDVVVPAERRRGGPPGRGRRGRPPGRGRTA